MKIFLATALLLALGACQSSTATTTTPSAPAGNVTAPADGASSQPAAPPEAAPSSQPATK